MYVSARAVWAAIASLGAAWLSEARPTQAQIHFVEVSAEVGVTHVQQTRSQPNAAGIALFDFDNDGRLDALFTEDQAACRLYRNEIAEGPASFRMTDVSEASGIAVSCRGSAAAVIDFDRDGFDDLLIASGRGVVLLANRPSPVGGGARMFVDRSAVAGFGGEAGAATLSVADFDADGWPDVYVGIYVVSARFPMHGCGRNRLYRNRGDGTFEEVAGVLGADDPGCALAATFVDADGDGFLDLLVANDFGLTVAPSDVLRFDGERFQSVGDAWGATQRMYAMGIAHGDIDGDGRLDFYVTNIGRNVLLRGSGGGFVDTTEEADVGLATIHEGGRTRFRASWGTALADFDLDGRLDLYVASGYLFAEDAIAVARAEPNVVFAGLGGGRFEAVSGEADDPRGSRGVAIGDLDGDGAPDLVISNVTTREQGAVEPRPAIYLARPPLNRRLAVRLRGTVCEPRAGGARLVVRTNGGGAQQRDVDTGGASHGSQHDPTLFFGFGDAALPQNAPKELWVRWPSGVSTRHDVPPAEERLEVSEPRWLRIPAVVSVEARVDLEVTPLAPGGALLGSGHVIHFSPSAGTMDGPATDLGDGAYAQSWRAPSSPRDVALELFVDGVRQRVRPRVRVIDGDATTLAPASAPLRTGEDSRVWIEPRDANGVPRGSGLDVVLLASAGTPRAADDLGDGTYAAHFVAPAARGTVRLQVLVQGELQGTERLVHVVEAFDPQRSRLEAVYAIVSPAERLLLRATPVDGAGRASPLLRSIVFSADQGELDERISFVQEMLATSWLQLPLEVPEAFRARASIAGMPFAREAIVATTGIASGAPPWLIDAARSRVIPFHQAMPADGRSLVRVMAVVRDTNGGFLPATPGTVFRTTGGQWRGPATQAIGMVASRCLIAPDAPGEARVCATVSGVELGECARIQFHVPSPGALVQDGCGEDALFAIIPEEVPDGGSGDAGVLQDGGGAQDGGSGAEPDAGARDGAAPEVDAGVVSAVDGAAQASPDAGSSGSMIFDAGSVPSNHAGGLPGSATPSAQSGGCDSAGGPLGFSMCAALAACVVFARRRRLRYPGRAVGAADRPNQLP
jgi:hypothetical protein